MGQKASQPQANITKINFNPETEVVGKTYDPHYGEIKIVRDAKTNETMILKDVVLNTKQSFETEQAYFNARVNVRHPNVVSVIGYNSQDKHNFCSTYYKLALYIEHLEDNLQAIFEHHRNSKTPLSEGELLLIADDLITGLSYFQSQGVSHGDIRPFNIFHKDQVYKLSDPSLNAQKNSNALTQAIVHGTKTLLSPELIPQVPQQKFEITCDKYKSDVYSLGATLLALATLTNSEELYDYEKGTINENLVRERLNNVRQNYSEFTHDLIEDMLIPQEANRPDSIILANKVGPHREYMRRAYQGQPLSYANSRTNIEERVEQGERVKRANLPTHDEDTSYKVGSIEELEARIRAAILRTEETFRIVKATPGLSGVYRIVEARHSVGGAQEGSQITPREPERLAKSQVGQDFTAYDYTSTAQPSSTYVYNYTNNVGGEERAVKASVPAETYESASANAILRASGTQQQPSGYTTSYVPASTYSYDVKTSGYGTGVDTTGLAGTTGVKTSGVGATAGTETRYSQNLGRTSGTYGTSSYTVPQGTTSHEARNSGTYAANAGTSGSQYYGIQTGTVGQSEQNTALDNLVNKIVDVATGKPLEKEGNFSEHVQVSGTQQASY